MSDSFRKAYRELSDAEKELVEQIKDAATRLEQQFDTYLARGGWRVREMALAKTNLEQAVMWAVKAIT